MSLQEKLDVLKANSAKKFPDDVKQTMQQSIENIKTSGIMQRFKNVGETAPDFQLKNTKGQIISLNDLLPEGNLVINFFRGKW